MKSIDKTAGAQEIHQFQMPVEEIPGYMKKTSTFISFQNHL